jgi:hypothetical protein
VLVVSALKESEFKSKFAFGLTRQFHGIWTMLRQGIEKIPDNQWEYGRDEWFYSVRVHHILKNAEFYSEDNPPEEELLGRGELRGLWWEKMSDEEAAKSITKQEVIKYLDEMQRQINQQLKVYSDMDLLKKDGFHEFSSISEKFILLLRHSSYHIGELALSLRSLECDRIKWD